MNADLEDIKMKKSSREKEKKATLDACRDGAFGTPYGGGDGDDSDDDDDDNDDDDDDDIDIAIRESLRTAAEDEHRRQMYSRCQSIREAGGSSGSKSSGCLFGRFRNVFSASGLGKQIERSTPASCINLEEEETQFIVSHTMIDDEQLFRRSGAKQKKLKELWNKNIVDNLGKVAAKLFLHNNILPHVVDSSHFQVFVDAAAEALFGVKAPSSY
ncbi:hypothetical protein ACLOJK_037431 [Asimina triloba]